MIIAMSIVCCLLSMPAGCGAAGLHAPSLVDILLLLTVIDVKTKQLL
jgi:hypothetical protein